MMIVLAYILFFVASFIATYFVSIFSAEKGNPVTVGISSFIMGIGYIILGALGLGGMIGVLFGTIFSIPVFIKFLGFDAGPALGVSFFYALIFPFILALILSIF